MVDRKIPCIICHGTGNVFRCLMNQKCITCDGLGYELYPQNNTQDTPKPLESGHNSSYMEGEKA